MTGAALSHNVKARRRARTKRASCVELIEYKDILFGRLGTNNACNRFDEQPNCKKLKIPFGAGHADMTRVTVRVINFFTHLFKIIFLYLAPSPTNRTFPRDTRHFHMSSRFKSAKPIPPVFFFNPVGLAETLTRGMRYNI